MLGCLIQALQRPDFDIVDRALVDVRQMASYEVRAAQRMEIVVHLTGLLTSRPELRVAIVYADLGLGELGRFLVEFRQMAGYSICRFVDRAGPGVAGVAVPLLPGRTRDPGSGLGVHAPSLVVRAVTSCVPTGQRRQQLVEHDRLGDEVIHA